MKEYNREKISVSDKVSSSVISNLKCELGLCEDDFITELLTVKLSGFIHSNMAEERDLIYKFKRPTFLDWLFRKERVAKFHLSVNDLLLNTSKPDNNERIYIVD